MTKISKISANTNYTAATVGEFNELGKHIYSHPAGIEIPGKVFIGEELRCTGTEVSFQIMPPAMGIDFLHTHKDNEELYVVIKGDGEYQVDGDIFSIAEGSVVRVATEGKRSWRNTGKESMVMMVIQSKTGSLKELGITDGVMVEEPIKW